MNQIITGMEFCSHPITAIQAMGKKWISAKDAGICLGYPQKRAGDHVGNIFRRNADEFDATDTGTFEMKVAGQIRKIRMFSASGCQLLGFWANTARAKEFRRWAKRYLTDQVPLRPHHTVTDLRPQIAGAAAHLHHQIDGADTNLHHQIDGAGQTQPAREAVQTQQQDYIRSLELNVALFHQLLKPKAKRAATRQYTSDEIHQAKAMRSQGMPLKTIAQKLNRSVGSISMLTRELH